MASFDKTAERQSQATRGPRVRFAPSPTGVLHVGGARTALFNYLFAKANGGRFIVRIEDTDQIRSTAAATQQVMQALRWLELDWDEGPEIGGEYGPYFQKERLSIYDHYHKKLLEEKKSYPCFCSAELLREQRARLENLGQPYVYDGRCLHLNAKEREEKMSSLPYTLRFRVGRSRMVQFEDLVRGRVSFDTKLIGDFVIRKADGFPTYNFAVVVDDGTMGISHVIRGDDHLSNTPRQLLLYQAFEAEFSAPRFAHVSMILNTKHQKLSKRDGAVDLMAFKAQGYLKEPLLNHLALLGWSPPDGVEVISRTKLEAAFKTLKFSSAPAVFDYAKLDYFNGLYLRTLPALEFVKLARAFLQQQQPLPPELMTHPRLEAQLLQVRGYCRKLSDLPEQLARFFSPQLQISAAWLPLLETAAQSGLFTLATECFSKAKTPFIEKEEMQLLSKLAREKLHLKGKAFFKPLRIKLTGTDSGIELTEFLTLIDRKTIIARLRA